MIFAHVLIDTKLDLCVDSAEQLSILQASSSRENANCLEEKSRHPSTPEIETNCPKDAMML